jgi:hypothetical protein
MEHCNGRKMKKYYLFFIMHLNNDSPYKNKNKNTHTHNQTNIRTDSFFIAYPIMDFTHHSNNNQHIFTFSTHSYNRADFAPEPTSQKTTQPPKKKAKTGRTIDKLANFEYYRKKWITETSQDVAHDLTEADCEDIIDAFLGYQKWRKGGLPSNEGVLEGRKIGRNTH